MAGDWIKMRESLHEDPAVLAMAAMLETRPEHVVGYCHRFWSWVSRNCPDGIVHGVTIASVEAVLNLPGFLSMMQKVGWLDVVESNGKPRFSIPKFDRHLSQGAKARGLEAERKRAGRVRKTSGSQPDKNGTREEKRREEKRRTKGEPPLHPPAGSRDPFDSWWEIVHVKTAVGAAKKAYRNAVVRLSATISNPHEFLRERMLAFAASPSAKPTDRSPIHPATWLNQDRFHDDPATWNRGAPTAIDPRGNLALRERMLQGMNDAN